MLTNFGSRGGYYHANRERISERNKELRAEKKMRQNNAEGRKNTKQKFNMVI